VRDTGSEPTNSFELLRRAELAFEHSLRADVEQKSAASNQPVAPQGLRYVTSKPKMLSVHRLRRELDLVVLTFD